MSFFVSKATKEEIEEAMDGVKRTGMKIFNKDWEGYTIKIDERKIICILDNEQDCCEHWDVAYFCKSIKTDKRLDKVKIEISERGDVAYDEGGELTIVVAESYYLEDTIVTKHIIKMWNAHNGYYAHNYIVYDTDGEFTRTGML